MNSSQPKDRLWFRCGAAISDGGFAAFSANDCPRRFFNHGRKARANAIGYAKQYLDLWISETSVHQAQHGLGDTTTLGNGIVGKFSALPLFLQKPNDFLADRFVMRKPIHKASVLQKTGLDMYFSDVQHGRAKRSNRDRSQGNIFLQDWHLKGIDFKSQKQMLEHATTKGPERCKP